MIEKWNICHRAKVIFFYSKIVLIKALHKEILQFQSKAKFLKKLQKQSLLKFADPKIRNFAIKNIYSFGPKINSSQVHYSLWKFNLSIFNKFNDRKNNPFDQKDFSIKKTYKSRKSPQILFRKYSMEQKAEASKNKSYNKLKLLKNKLKSAMLPKEEQTVVKASVERHSKPTTAPRRSNFLNQAIHMEEESKESKSEFYHKLDSCFGLASTSSPAIFKAN